MGSQRLKDSQFVEVVLAKLTNETCVFSNRQAHRQSRLSIAVFYQPKESGAPQRDDVVYWKPEVKIKNDFQWVRLSWRRSTFRSSGRVIFGVDTGLAHISEGEFRATCTGQLTWLGIQGSERKVLQDVESWTMLHHLRRLKSQEATIRQGADRQFLWFWYLSSLAQKCVDDMEIDWWSIPNRATTKSCSASCAFERTRNALPSLLCYWAKQRFGFCDARYFLSSITIACLIECFSKCWMMTSSENASFHTCVLSS